MADKFRACSVPGCKGNAHWTKSGAKGYCRSHNRQFSRGPDFVDKRRNRTDLTGKKFHRLTALRHVGISRDGTYIWRFACECGSETEAIGSRVVNGHTKSCGCYNRDRMKISGKSLGISNVTHGSTKTKEYRAWAAMRARCTKETHKSYASYGGRGITVCDRWSDSFENFIADMGLAPSKGFSLDRIDNDKGYSPDNCRWATRVVQASNTRTNKYVEIGADRLSIAEAVRKYGMAKYSAVLERIKAGMDPISAIMTPPIRTRR